MSKPQAMTPSPDTPEAFRNDLAKIRTRLVALKVYTEALLAEKDATIERLTAENKAMREVLEWLGRKGGLGLDVHERIRAALQAIMGDEPRSP